MNTSNFFSKSLATLTLIAVALLAACATPPADDDPAPLSAPASRAEKDVKVDESAILPLLGYLQLLARLTPQELARERAVLLYIPPTPSTQVRLAMLLGQPRGGGTDLPRALVLLDKVLKAGEPAATSVHPLARMLANQYQERLRLQAQNEKLMLQLTESLRQSSDLQLKLDALADIERSLPVRPSSGEKRPGSLR